VAARLLALHSSASPSGRPHVSARLTPYRGFELIVLEKLWAAG
jgi:hypothetical protein